MAIKEVLKQEHRIKELAATLVDTNSLLLLGRGYQYATCVEGYVEVFGGVLASR